jgi:hypothetical protein
MKFTVQRLCGALRSWRLQGLCLTVALGATSLVCHAQVINGNFADPPVTATVGYQMFPAVKAWTTTDREKVFEVWKDGTKDPAHNNRVFFAPPGIKQFVEVAAYSHGKLSQQVNGIKDGSQYGFSFWHRGRHSGDTEEDTIEVSVKDGNNPVWTKRFFTTAKEWKQYTVPVGKKSETVPLRSLSSPRTPQVEMKRSETS